MPVYKVSPEAVVRFEPDGIYVMTRGQQKEKITDFHQRMLFEIIALDNAYDEPDITPDLRDALQRWERKGIIERNPNPREFASAFDGVVNTLAEDIEIGKAKTTQHTIDPIYMTIGITSKCNCACKHCGNDSKRAAHADDLLYDEIIEQLNEMCRMALLKINFTGGEPTESPHLIEYIEYVKGYIPRITMTSNGYNITDFYAKALHDAGCNMVKLSIDGMRDFHDDFRGLDGCWEHAISAIGNLQRHDIEVRVQTTLTKRNVRDMFELSSLLSDKGVTHQTIVPVCPIGRAERNMMLTSGEYKSFLHDYCPKIAELYKRGCKTHFQVRPVFGEQDAFKEAIGTPFETLSTKYSCEALHNTMEVRANGDVVPCSFLDKIIGNTRSNSLREIWGSEAANVVRQELHDSLNNSAACRQCDRAGTDCNGGCLANRTSAYCDCDPYCFVVGDAAETNIEGER